MTSPHRRSLDQDIEALVDYLAGLDIGK